MSHAREEDRLTQKQRDKLLWLVDVYGLSTDAVMERYGIDKRQVNSILTAERRKAKKKAA